ncbi:hypothetical protein TRAPUB_3234 [Trametes pubescens]|uniref:Uncharacterized protein n=1 Tax=Trametes pubescens TaxID=154538 RepID=A0A1M2VE77_TRAPU|nr:hypothetical protein TRAPUB_3234 [Trametes pubescens]
MADAADAIGYGISARARPRRQRTRHRARRVGIKLDLAVYNESDELDLAVQNDAWPTSDDLTGSGPDSVSRPSIFAGDNAGYF